MLAPGRCIAGRHRLIRLLGRGGMGDVWHVRNEAVERDYAMKILSIAAGDDEPIAKRLLREGRAAGRLRHPNIIEIFDAAIDPEVGPYLVMELLDGRSLGDVLRRGALPIEATLSIGVTIARALHVAHEAGVIHRDLKAGNVFLHRTREGAIAPKLLDFGISKLHAVSEEQVTLEGTVLGSPLAMSPEQAMGRLDVDRRTDVWSLGALLYRMLTGKNPFRGATPGALLRAVVIDDPVPPAELAPDAPAELCALIERCLQKDARARPASTAEVESTLVALARRYGQADLHALIAECEPDLEGSITEPRTPMLTAETPAMLPMPVAPDATLEVPIELTTVEPKPRKRTAAIAVSVAALLGAIVLFAIPRRAPEPTPASPRIETAPSIVEAPSESAPAVVVAPPPSASTPKPLTLKKPKPVTPSVKATPAQPKPTASAHEGPNVDF